MYKCIILLIKILVFNFNINEIDVSDINKELNTNEIIQPSDESQINNEFDTNEAQLQDLEQLINNGIIDDDISEDYDQNLSSFFKDEAISKEELSAAFMAAFYNGRSTQSSLFDYLRLANIFSPIKIPTTFDGLKRQIQGKSTDLVFNKTWFCGTCLKIIKMLNNRFQRTFDVCKSRLNMYYNFDIEQQLKTILKKFKISELINKNNSTSLNDFRDGNIYKYL